MRIVVDKREKDSLVLSELISEKVEAELRTLEVADYIVGDVAIERKTVHDFVSSMINKRLLRQLAELKQYKKRILLIEGLDEYSLYEDDNGGMNANAIRGMILSCILEFNVPIIFTKDYKDTAKFLIVLARKFERGRKDFSFRAKRNGLNMKEQQQFILEGFPGVGASIAKELLKRFKTIKNVINLNTEQFSEIKKLGKKKARFIYEIINREY